MPNDKHTTPYTYLIGWKDEDLWYYGVRYASGCSPSDLWKTYFTSSKRVADLRLAFGEPDVIEIRKVFNATAPAVKWESVVLRRIKAVASKKWVNLGRSGVSFNTQDPGVRAAISLSKTGHTTSPETRSKIGAKSKGRSVSSEARKKISLANTNKVVSAETKEKISSARMGIRFSEETKEKMRAKRTGRKDSSETIAKRIATLAARRAACQS